MERASKAPVSDRYVLGIGLLPTDAVVYRVRAPPAPHLPWSGLQPARLARGGHRVERSIVLYIVDRPQCRCEQCGKPASSGKGLC
eukprot:scaffold1653_cov389-Prasinococcus_capsulatus_cf.AAC.14